MNGKRAAYPDGNVIPVFVISLSDSERRGKILNRLNRLCIPFEFVDAVDGRVGLAPEHEREIDRVRARRNGMLMTDAEFACALSHVKVCQKIVQDNIDRALVLEDDAIPTNDLPIYLCNRYFEHADLVQLDYRRTHVRRTGCRPLFGPYCAWLRVKARSTGSAGYVISHRGAELIATHAMPVHQVSDWPDCVDKMVKERRVEVVYPRLVHHPKDGDSSTISTAHGAIKDSRKFLGIYIPPLRYVMRSWARWPWKLLGKKLS